MGVYDIQGKNCVFQLKIGDEYLTVVCAKSFTFNPVTDMKETTTVGSGFWKEFRPRKLSYTISFSGMLQVASLITQEKVKTLFDYQIQFLPIVYRMLYYDNSNNVMNVNGTAYVSSNLFDASPVNLVNSTTELQGNGPIEILDYIPDFINVTVEVTGEADAKCRFVLFDADGNIKYDTSTLEELLPTAGWIVQGESVTLVVQKGQYAWGISTDDILSDVNTFDLDITPAVSESFPGGDHSQNSLPTTYDFLTDKTATFTIGPESPPPACVPVAIVGSPALPDGQVGVAYNYSFATTGSSPFTLSSVTKPSWMTIAVNETTPGSDSYIVQFSGTPDAIGGETISFDIDNACGSVSFSDSISITAGSAKLIFWNLTVESGTFGNLKIYKNGVLVVNSITTGSSGSFASVTGDSIEAQAIGSIVFEKELTVTGSVSGVIFTDTDTVNIIHSFTASGSENYTISCDVHNV